MRLTRKKGSKLLRGWLCRGFVSCHFLPPQCICSDWFTDLLCYLADLQFSPNLEVTSLMISYIFLQYYQTSNETKIQSGYQELNEYKDIK